MLTAEGALELTAPWATGAVRRVVTKHTEDAAKMVVGLLAAVRQLVSKARAAAMAKMWAADDMVVMTAQRARTAERHVGVAAQMVMGKAS